MDPLDPTEHEALLQFLYQAPIGLVQCGVDGEVSMLNPRSAQLLFPLAPQGDLSNFFSTFESVAPELRSKAQSFAGERGTICEHHRVQLTAGSKGKEDPQFLEVTLIKLDAARLMAVVSDVTRAVKQERLLRQSEAWFNAILTGVTDYALATVDERGEFEEWNHSIQRLTGRDEAATLGQNYSVLYPEGGITEEQVLDQLREADSSGWSLSSGWRVRQDGSRFWGSTLLVPLNAQEHPGDDHRYALIVRDITDRRQAMDQMLDAASRDHLTGLPNRRAFFEGADVEIQRWRRYPRALSLVMFDCDKFKDINDRLGHAAGDAVLKHFAQVLRELSREVDVIARMGGEEFVAMLPSTDEGGARNFAQRVLRHLATTSVEFAGENIAYTVSAGVATFSPETAGLDALLQAADRALYKAKAMGRNRVEV